MSDAISHCLPPVTGNNTSILILGSLPSLKSLELSQYYGHPRNHFWPLMAGLTAYDLPSLPYVERLDHIKQAGIGLWDVVAHAMRQGSLDQHIRSASPNRLASLINALPYIRAIAFNGKTASRIGRRQLTEDVGSIERMATIELIDLPSSSPANTIPYEDKTAQWNALRPYIKPRI